MISRLEPAAVRNVSAYDRSVALRCELLPITFDQLDGASVFEFVQGRLR